MLAENPLVFLQDFGVSCVAGGQTFLGVLDTPDETLNMADVNVISTMYCCTVRTSDVAAAGLSSGSAITVAGVSYVIRDVLLQDDGVFSHLSLSR